MRIIHMADIISLLGLPPPPPGRSSYYISCPCCDSGRNKHLNINFTKDVFRCPRCGFYGGIFDLYAHYTGIRREDVRGELIKKLGDVDSIGKSFIERVYDNPLQPEISTNPITDIVTRNATYQALLDMLSLASDHRDNLVGRGLSFETIVKNGYKSTPVAGIKMLARKLMEEGHYLAGVPGFYRDKDSNWTFAYNRRGILIPVRDHCGRIQGLQIRRDKAEKRKFRWLSSADFPDGCCAEGWIHLAGPMREQILLTEGPMKADVIHHLTGETVIAVPGVNSLTRLEASLQIIIKLGVRHIMTAFDMDFMVNPHVQNGYWELISLLGRLDISFGTYLWHPEYKGLDDYVWEYLMAKQHRQ